MFQPARMPQPFSRCKSGTMQQLPSRAWSCSSLMEAAKLVVRAAELPAGAALEQQQALLGDEMKNKSVEELLQMLEDSLSNPQPFQGFYHVFFPKYLP